MRILLALLVSALNVGAASYYLDPDYTGGGSDGSITKPWTSIGTINWTTINTSLASGAVTLYCSALKAGGGSPQSSASYLNIQRTDSSTNRLTIDGYSFYNNNAASPSWVVNPNPISTAFTNGQVFTIRRSGSSGLGWGRADGASVVTQGGLPYNCIRSHVSSAITQPGIGANWQHYWAQWGSGGSPWVTATAYSTFVKQDNVTMRGFDITNGISSGLGDNLVFEYFWSHDCTTLGAQHTILYTTFPDQATPNYVSDYPNTNILIHDFRINNTDGEGVYVGAVNPDASAAFQVSQTNQMDGLTISNGVIYNCGFGTGQGDGVDMKNGILHVTISNVRIGRGDNRQGGIIIPQTQTPNLNQNCLIDSCVIQTTTHTGGSENEAIYMNSSSIAGGKKGYNGVTIRNCVIDQNWLGLHCSNGGGTISNIFAYNNLIRWTTNEVGIDFEPQDSVSEVKNNIVYNNNGGGAQNSFTAGVIAQTNAYGGGTWSGAGGSVSGVVDADFVSATTGNFQLTGTSAREYDQGVTISSFNYDILGVTRPQAFRWDIGPYEFKAFIPVITNVTLIMK